MPMPNNTFEDYKIAVKNKYEKEKDGIHSNYLSFPTRAKLRNLCWEIFEKQNAHQDDLTVFNTLLGLRFDLTTKNKFREEIDRFRPIETFFKGETDPTNVDAVNLAAILLDFHPRPFSKFRTSDLVDESKEAEHLIQPLNDVNEEKVEAASEKEIEISPADIKPISFFISFKEWFFKSLLIKSKWTIASVALIFCLISAVIYLAYLKKDCMQWSEDHYEKVDCDFKADGLGMTGKIERFDETKFGLKKIKVCDTTTLFIKGEAIIWYAKTANGVDFFNTHGRHPENDKPLRPVTPYIVNKYGDKLNVLKK